MVAKQRWVVGSFIFAGLGLLAGALLHVVVLVGGPDWIAFVGAPASVVDSARSGTWLAPVGALSIAVLLALWALYAFSAAGVVRRLPLLRTVLVFISVVFIVRGLIIIPALAGGRINWRAPIDLFVVASSLLILTLGLSIAAGLTGCRNLRPATSDEVIQS